MRLQAKYLGEFRTVRIPDELYELFSIAVDDPGQEIRDFLADIQKIHTEQSTASEAAKSMIVGYLKIVVRHGKA